MSTTPHVGSVTTNKYGVQEVVEGAETRRRLKLLDKDKRIWQALRKGVLTLDPGTTHIRVTLNQVERHGSWRLLCGKYMVDIGPEKAGQQIDFVFPRANAKFLYTERSGMTRFDSAPLLIQELQLEDE